MVSHAAAFFEAYTFKPLGSILTWRVLIVTVFSLPNDLLHP